jgi:hypothetical protein
MYPVHSKSISKLTKIIYTHVSEYDVLKYADTVI